MADVAIPTFKKRTKTSNIRKRPATPPPTHSSSSSEDSDSDTAEARIKRRKKEGVHISTGAPTNQPPLDFKKSSHFAADRSTALASNDDATKTSHWDEDAVAAAAEARAKTLHQPVPTDNNDDDAERATNTAKSSAYKGVANYSTFIAPPREGKTLGPVKAAAANVRTITTTDFAPDVCKDYKQTGFCGFGDGCKFLHAREDYKQGWQLDREWEKAGKTDKKKMEGQGQGQQDLTEEEKMLEGIPFKCIICKDDYKVPVVTKCGHYFCEKCAMGRYMREKRRTCAACGVDTGGSFGVARKLRELLEKKRRRVDEMAEKEGRDEEDTKD